MSKATVGLSSNIRTDTSSPSTATASTVSDVSPITAVADAAPNNLFFLPKDMWSPRYDSGFYTVTIEDHKLVRAAPAAVTDNNKTIDDDVSVSVGGNTHLPAVVFKIVVHRQRQRSRVWRRYSEFQWLAREWQKKFNPPPPYPLASSTLTAAAAATNTHTEANAATISTPNIHHHGPPSIRNENGNKNSAHAHAHAGPDSDSRITTDHHHHHHHTHTHADAGMASAGSVVAVSALPSAWPLWWWLLPGTVKETFLQQRLEGLMQFLVTGLSRPGYAAHPATIAFLEL